MAIQALDHLTQSGTSPGKPLTSEELKARVDLRELVRERYGHGKRVGSALQFNAPWRSDDDHASFTVYADGYKDFGGAGESGDIFDWLQREYNLTFLGTVAWLRERLGSVRTCELRQRAPPPLANSEPPSNDWQRAIQVEALDPSTTNLFSGGPASTAAYNYLRFDRCLTDETIRAFRLGFSPTGRTLQYRKHGKPVYQLPGISIPRYVDGALFGVNLRLPVGSFAEALGVPSLKDREGQAHKYKHLLGSQSAGVLFNGDAITPGNEVLFTEGEFDAMLAQQELGSSAAVVTFGSASNVKKHLPKRWHDRLHAAGRIYLTFDGDAAGDAAATRLILSLRAIGIEPKLLPVPAGKDVTDYVRDHDGNLERWWAHRDEYAVACEQPGNLDLSTIRLDYEQEFTPMTLRQAGRMMVCCPEYVLIEQHMVAMDCTDDFTVAQLARSIGCSLDKAQRLIKQAMQWQSILERSAEKRRIESSNPIRMNAAERELQGAAKARHYHLSPELAEYALTRELGNHVQELMEWGEPDVIAREEVLNAGRNAQEAADLEAITRVVARSEAAFVVSADAERAGAKKARELEWLAESDQTLFKPDRLAESITDLRVQLVEALISTNPEADWRHAELMWIAGVKRNSIGSLIQKSCFAPAATPTYKPVVLEGKNLHAAVKKKCIEERGAPVAWLNGRGDIIASFGRSIPQDAQGVLLNVGKKYICRSQAPASAASPETTDSEEIEQKDIEPPLTELELAQQEQQRGERRAQRAMLSRLRGCIRARGWRYVPGPYGYWERGEITHTNTWAGMVEALLEDSQWAREEQAHWQAETGEKIFLVQSPNDNLIAFAASLGAVVMELA